LQIKKHQDPSGSTARGLSLGSGVDFDGSSPGPCFPEGDPPDEEIPEASDSTAAITAELGHIGPRHTMPILILARPLAAARPRPTEFARAAARRNANASKPQHGAHWQHCIAALMSPGRALARCVERAHRKLRGLPRRRGLA
jgi:hypothetical protein